MVSHVWGENFGGFFFLGGMRVSRGILLEIDFYGSFNWSDEFRFINMSFFPQTIRKLSWWESYRCTFR